VLGHFVKENPTDKELQAVATSLGYADYFSTKPVPFPTAPQKEKIHQVRTTEADFETIKQLQDFWKLPNQPSVVSKLIERHEKTVELGKQLQELQTKNNQLAQEKREMTEQLEQLQARVNQLEQEKAQMSQVQPQSPESTDLEAKLEAKIEQLIEEKLSKALSNLAIAQPNNQTPDSKPVTQTPTKQLEVIDWESKSNAEIWSSKAKGASEEKIRRSFNAITLYNDTIATGDEDRLAITNQALRELSGVNGLIVGDWLKAHADEVISHNSKYGMQNSKDPQRLDTYYNKRHGAEKVTKILALVNEQVLDGEALKSQQAKA
jgi:FtsZ-binding cell division protein ZapB